MPERRDCHWNDEKYDEQVDAWLEDPPEALVDWAADQDLRLDKARPRPHWANLQEKLKRWGMLEAGKAWVAQQVHDLRHKYKLVDANGALRDRAFRRLSHRFMEDRLLRSERVARLFGPGKQGKEKSTDPDMEKVPAFLRWVAQHPSLAMDVETEQTDPVAQALVASYERNNPRPNRYSAAILMRIRDDPRQFDKLLEKVVAAVMAERKKVKEVASEEDPEVVEADLVAAEIDEMLAKFGE